MSKKDKIKTIEVDDVNLVPELLDGNHRVIPIVTGGDEPVEEVEVPEIIPILTLRSSVLFPGAITPITVGRDKSINLVRAVNAEGGILGAVLQRESDVEDPAPDDMYKVGTAARIIKILEMPNGNLTVILNGLEKVEITEYITTEPYFKARVTALRDSTPDVKSIEFEALVDSIRDVALNIINVSPSMPKEAAFAIKNIDSKRGIINFICSNMELTDEDRQSLLEAPGLLARARKLLEILIREQQLAELKNQIQERVKQEIDKQQRDYYLQQQMRTIQDELGDGADADIEKMREEAKKKNWPAEVGETFEKELQKVERLNPAVAEYSVQMTYLQLLLELPWNDVTKDNLDLKCAREQLDHDHFGLDEVKERILETLAVRKEHRDLAGIPVADRLRVLVEHAGSLEVGEDPVALVPELVRHEDRHAVGLFHDGCERTELAVVDVEVRLRRPSVDAFYRLCGLRLGKPLEVRRYFLAFVEVAGGKLQTGRRLRGRVGRVDGVLAQLDVEVPLEASVRLHHLLVERYLHVHDDGLLDVEPVLGVELERDVLRLLKDRFLGEPAGLVLHREGVGANAYRCEVDLLVSAHRLAKALAFVQEPELSPEIHQAV